MHNPDTRPLDIATALDDLSARGLQRVESHAELLRDASGAIRLLYQLFIEASIDNMRLRNVEIEARSDLH